MDGQSGRSKWTVCEILKLKDKKSKKSSTFKVDGKNDKHNFPFKDVDSKGLNSTVFLSESGRFSWNMPMTVHF